MLDVKTTTTKVYTWNGRDPEDMSFHELTTAFIELAEKYDALLPKRRDPVYPVPRD